MFNFLYVVGKLTLVAGCLSLSEGKTDNALVQRHSKGVERNGAAFECPVEPIVRACLYSFT